MSELATQMMLVRGYIDRLYYRHSGYVYLYEEMHGAESSYALSARVVGTTSLATY